MTNLDRIISNILENRQKIVISKTNLVALIEPVSRCNLACRYCAANGWKSHGKLNIISKEILNDFLTKLADFITKYDTKAAVTMHGYEPLQAGMETFAYVQDKVNELGIRDRVIFGVQTNGTLLNDEWADFFIKNEWFVGFSIDGPKRYHDAFRVFPNGKGSYDLAIRGYKIYSEKRGKPAGIISTITSAYRRPSLEESAQIYYDWLRENGMKSAIVHMTAADPRNPLSKIFAMAPDEYARWYVTLYKIWADSKDGIDIKPFTEIVDAMVTGVAKYSACSMRNGCWRVISIGYNGILHLCDRWSYVGKHISQYKTLEDFLFKDPELIKQSLRAYMLRKFDSECSKCEYFRICQGGCANEGIYNYYSTGYAINRVPQWSRTQYCSAYKQIFRTIEEDLRNRGIELGFRKN